MKLVTVATGYSNVPILGGLYNQGQQIILTDDQFNALPLLVKNQINVRSAAPDVAPSGPQPNPTTYTDQTLESTLIHGGVPIYLIWDGSTYQPNLLMNAVDRPKVFVGPQDPHTFAGVTLAVRDQWINY